MKFGFVLRFRDPPRGENVRQMWLENLEMAKLCEEVGFDSCFTAEHHGIVDGYNPSPLITCAFIAGQTTRLKVGTAVFLLPFYHPLHVAEDAAMIDVLSNGRMILGLGISNAEREFIRHGLKIKNQVSIFEEGIEILQRAWTEDVFSFYGRNYSFKNQRVTPRPVQKPHPPIWLGAGTPFGFRRAARLGLPVFLSAYLPVDVAKEWTQIYRDLAKQRGNRPEVILWRDGFVSPNGAKAKEVEETFWKFGREELWFYFSSFPGREDEWFGMAERLKKEEDFKREDVRPNLLLGTPEEVIEQIERLKEEIGVDYVVFRSRYGTGPPMDEAMSSLRLFGEKVIPHFADS